MSYQESLIVPLETYRKLCRKEEEKPSLLNDDDIPSDLKMKLFDLGQWRSGKRQSREDSPPGSDLLEKMQAEGRHPFARKIVDRYLVKNSRTIAWHPVTYEIIIDGKLMPKTNIIRSLQYLLKPEGMNYVRPPGTDTLRAKLVEVGVPEGWMHKEIESIVAPPPTPRPPSAILPPTPPPSDEKPIKSVLAPVKTKSRTLFPGSPIGSRTRAKTGWSELPVKHGVRKQSKLQKWDSYKEKPAI